MNACECRLLVVLRRLRCSGRCLSRSRLLHPNCSCICRSRRRHMAHRSLFIGRYLLRTEWIYYEVVLAWKPETCVCRTIAADTLGVITCSVTDRTSFLLTEEVCLMICSWLRPFQCVSSPPGSRSSFSQWLYLGYGRCACLKVAYRVPKAISLQGCNLRRPRSSVFHGTGDRGC